MHKAFGRDDRRSLLTATLLGEVLLKQNSTDEAEVLLRDTHGRLTSTLGAEHRDTLRTACYLGRTLVRGGSADEGVAVLTSTHNAQLRVLGPTHTHTQQTLSELERAQQSSSIQQPKKRRVEASP